HRALCQKTKVLCCSFPVERDRQV
ncbi:uncharacterized protein METZ01_LOCUS163720, partial [marine metagenome]